MLFAFVCHSSHPRPGRRSECSQGQILHPRWVFGKSYPPFHQPDVHWTPVRRVQGHVFVSWRYLIKVVGPTSRRRHCLGWHSRTLNLTMLIDSYLNWACPTYSPCNDNSCPRGHKHPAIRRSMSLWPFVVFAFWEWAVSSNFPCLRMHHFGSTARYYSNWIMDRLPRGNNTE